MGACLLGGKKTGNKYKFHTDVLAMITNSYTYTTTRPYDFVAVCFTRADDGSLTMDVPVVSSGVTNWTAAVNNTGTGNNRTACYYGYADKGEKIPTGSTFKVYARRQSDGVAVGAGSLILFGVYYDDGIAEATLDGSSSDGTWTLNSDAGGTFDLTFVNGAGTLGFDYNVHDTSYWSIPGFTFVSKNEEDLSNNEFIYRIDVDSRLNDVGVLCFKRNGITTLEDWLSWLSSHPLTVYYPTR